VQLDATPIMELGASEMSLLEAAEPAASEPSATPAPEAATAETREAVSGDRPTDSGPPAGPAPDESVAASAEPAPAPAESVPAPAESLAEPVAKEQAPVAVADPYAGIPHQRQLPSSVQRELPELEITVHIYSETPSARLVRINRRNYREGELVDNQLTLEEITPDGLVMSFGDIRFWRYVR